MTKQDIRLPRGQSQFQVVGRFVPNEKYDEANPQCKVYRMNLFAKNRVVARSRFWYFMSKMCRVKRANGQIISVSEIYEKSPLRVKNFGIWFRYESRTGTHNAYKEYRELSLTAAVNAMCKSPSRAELEPSHARPCRRLALAAVRTADREGRRVWRRPVQAAGPLSVTGGGV